MTRVLVLSLAFLLMSGCGKKPSVTPDAGAKATAAGKKAAAEPLAPLPTTVEGWIGLVPADAKVAAVVLDARKLLGVVGSLEGSLGRLPFGAGLVAQAHAVAARAPVPIPWNAAELRKLGIDEQKPILLVVRERMPLALFGVSDEGVFKKNLAQIATRGGGGSWKQSTHDGITLAALIGGPPLHCAFAPGSGRCSPDPELVVQSLRRAPEKSLWTALSAEEQRLARSAHALLHRGDQGALVVARVEADGLSVEGRARGLPLARFGSLAAQGAGSTKLLALTRGARSALRLRLSVEALAALSARESEALAKVGLDPKDLREALSGEIVGVESADGVALVLGCKDASGAPKLVTALGALLEKGAKLLQQQKAGKDRPSLKVKKTTIAGRPAYRVQIESTRPELPLKLEVALAAGPLGLFLGAPAAIEPLAKLSEPPPPPASAAPITPEEQRAFDERAVLSLRMGLGDPLGAAAPQIEAAIASAGLPPQAKQGIDLARFMLDQMDSATIGILLDPKEGGHLGFVLRLTTLHRDGVAEDDAARDAWAKALQAKLGGDRAAFDEALKKLAAANPKSRYGGLLERQKGGLLTVASTGVLAAVAIPAFIKYTRRAKLVEVHQNLARIASAGKFQEGKFPATTPWTPARPCCQGKTARRCTPEAKDWEHPTWKALGFALSDPHYFQYRFVASGKSFTAEARGDLDCDGKSSSFSIEGTRGADGSVSLSPMRSTNPEE
jgi:hypothetical protein